MKNSDWDLDLRHGLDGENKLRELLQLETVEVKTDRKWHKTGNLYIEAYCFYQKTQSWEPNGLNISKATHWAFPLSDMTIILTREALIRAVKEHGVKIECKIEPNPSRGFLIKPEQLLQSVRYAVSLD